MEIKEIEKIKNGQDKRVLIDLAVSLRSRPMRWISEFLEHGGLAVILDNLNELEELQQHGEFEELYIKCLKSFMNNKIGLSAVLEVQGAMSVIALGLRSPSSRTKTLVFDIFAAVCMLPGGHSQVLSALSTLSDISGWRSRFEIAVYTLWQSCKSDLSSIQTGTPIAQLSSDKELQGNLFFNEMELTNNQKYHACALLMLLFVVDQVKKLLFECICVGKNSIDIAHDF